ncbi:MAG TPA: class I SAM-dependent methyltransferase [Pseudomonadota bacterium]|jgi:SAM-dependent methyltransferase|nr:class I SAM-dependent methyltransferase [Pseudomonadota bacterium]
MAEHSYDRIADVYATDMGASMRFDDIGYYRDLCRRVGGKVLELGCGTGRILLPLLAAGVDIEGLDRSAPMLARLHADAAARGLAAKTHHRDLRTMPEDLAFDVLLAPYSLVTYLTEPGALQDWLHGARQMLHPDGLLVVDAFLPRDVAPFDDFREDYLRPHGDGLLRREKRIAREGRCNRIERRYTLLDADRATQHCWTTTDLIRPWTPQQLVDAIAGAGFDIEGCDLDYGQGQAPHQFATHRARRP